MLLDAISIFKNSCEISVVISGCISAVCSVLSLASISAVPKAASGTALVAADAPAAKELKS